MARVKAIRLDHRSKRAAAKRESDLAHLAQMWWGEGGPAARKPQRRLLVGAAIAGVAIASVAGIAAKPSGSASFRLDLPPATAHHSSAPNIALPATLPPPADYAVEMTVKLAPGQDLEQLLVKTGAAPQQARRAAALLEDELPRDGAPLTVFLGDRNSDGSRRIEQIAVRASLARHVAVVRQVSGGLKLLTREIAVDGTPLRIVGTVGGGLFWSLRAAGATPELASEYVSVIAGRGASAAPGDRFELVVDQRRAVTGEVEQGALQYAGLDRRRGGDVRLVRWTLDGRRSWIDPDQPGSRAAALALPLGGRISSPFGVRTHPIFRTARFHRGVDIRAAWGTPVLASADGQVTTSGWSGGYGLRVRVAHRDGLATSYSHLSRITVPIGSSVRQGELIGFVGSTGFSTGAHLHFELFRGSEAVDPLGANLAATIALSRSDRAALSARLSQLSSVPAA